MELNARVRAIPSRDKVLSTLSQGSFGPVPVHDCICRANSSSGYLTMEMCAWLGPRQSVSLVCSKSLSLMHICVHDDSSLDDAPSGKLNHLVSETSDRSCSIHAVTVDPRHDRTH